MVTVRCSNEIMEMQARYNKRMKWNSKKLEDTVISQKCEHDTIRRLARQAESSDIHQE
jgi:hypothetical protein